MQTVTVKEMIRALQSLPEYLEVTYSDSDGIVFNVTLPTIGIDAEGETVAMIHEAV